jgi:hypothetical protein
MANIGVFREAKINQISSLNHLFNTHEQTNQNPLINPNLANNNSCYIWDNEASTTKLMEFKRDGNNQDVIDLLRKKEISLDKEAREDYKKHKLNEKANNPGKKVRTVLQSKNLKKEFGIFVGGDMTITNKAEFEARALKTAIKVLEKKGLSEKNLLSLTVHFDEKTPHIHCQYLDYSWKHKTTGTEHSKTRFVPGMDKKQLRKLNRDNFAEFQDLVADGMGMQRGQRNSKAINRKKSEHFREETEKHTLLLIQQKAELARLNAEIQRQETNKLRNEDLEETIENNKKIIKGQDQQINKNDEIIKDKVNKTSDSKVRVDIGALGIRRIFNKMATNEGLTLAEWTKKHGPTYNPTDGFKVIEEAFKQLPQVQNMQISRDKELTR